MLRRRSPSRDCSELERSDALNDAGEHWIDRCSATAHGAPRDDTQIRADLLHRLET